MQSINSVNWPDNSSYRGESVGSYPNGKGLFTTASGRVYEGLWSYGFSFGLFRVWLESYLEIHNPYKNFIEKKVDEINFFQESVFSKLRTSSPVFKLKSGFLLAKQVHASSKHLVSEYYEYLQSDAVAHSNDTEFGAREYSCGGKFPSLKSIKEKIVPLAMEITPLRELNIAIEKLESDIERVRSFLLSSPNFDEKEKEIISQFLYKD